MHSFFYLFRFLKFTFHFERIFEIRLSITKLLTAIFMIDFSSKMVVCVHSDYRILLKVQEERYFAKFRYGDKLYNNFDVPYRKRFNANACVRVCLPIPFDDPSMDQEEQEEEPKKRQNTRSSSGWYSISTRKIKQKKTKAKILFIPNL